MKKVFLLLLSCVLAVSVFARGKQEGSGSTEDPMEISVGFWLIGDSISKNYKDPFTLYMEEKFNVEFIDRNLTWGDYNEKTLLWGASGDLPDVFASDMMLKEVYYQWIEEGLLRSLPADLSAYPNVEKVVAQDSVQPLAIDGEIFLFPRVSGFDSSYDSSARGIISRKDWREALGMERPETFEEYLALAKAFVEMDPDGNGIDDTVGMTFTNKNYSSMVFLSSVPEAASGTWKFEDGRWVPPFTSKGMIDGVMELHTLWNEGVMDPDTLSISGDYGYERFAEGKTGMLFTQAKANRVYGLSSTWEKYNDTNLADLVEFLPIWVNDEGERHAFHSGKNFWSSSYFSSTVSDEKMDRIMAIYDYLLSEEGQNAVKFGIPGVDFVMESGKVKRIDDSDMLSKYPSIGVFINLPAWSGELFNWIKDDYSLSLFDEDIMDMCFAQYEASKSILSPVNMDIEYLYTPLKAKFARILEGAMDSVLIAMVSDDPEAEWNKFMDSLRTQGLEDVIKEVNAEAARLGIE